jgi:Tfp pilus assembly protein PilN
MPDINLIPKEYKKRGIDLKGIFSKAVGIVLALLILSLLIYGGLLIYQKSLIQKIDNLKQATEKLESKRNETLENSIIGADQKLSSVENLFKNHFYWSELFAKIEQLVVSDVYFSDIKTVITDGKLDLTLSGNAKTYTGLARQMISFKEDALVDKVELSDLKLSATGGIDFALSVLIFKSILINQTETK